MSVGAHDPTLDFSLDAMEAAIDEPVPPPEDPWLQRRALGFGASDMPALVLALVDKTREAPKYIADRARITNRTRGYPRIVAEKAGLLAPLASGEAANRGTQRERELLEQWRLRLEHGSFYCDAERLIDASRVRHSDVAMRCAMPWVDRFCPPLTATLDAWATDTLGAEVAVELKCSASERRELPWYWRTQMLAQLAVCGEQWAAWHGNDGPIRCWLVERDESAIDALRVAARAGWSMVEKLKTEMVER
jgi:hypothetical protein